MANRYIGRVCRVCGKPISREADETPRKYEKRITCRDAVCVSRYRAIRAQQSRDQDEARRTRQLQEWPEEMAELKPFADDVRTVTAGSIGLPATLCGGCSSSAGWQVGGE